MSTSGLGDREAVGRADQSRECVLGYSSQEDWDPVG